MDKKCKDKKYSVILIKLLLVMIISCIVLIIIGLNSNYLISKKAWYIIIIFEIIYVLLLLFAIKKYKKNKKAKYKEKKSLKNLYIIFISLYLLGCSSFVFLLYGPYKGFKTWLITTAMQTMNHKFYCLWFYDENDLNSVLNSNYIVELDESTDISLIKKQDITVYSSEEEKLILQKEEGNDLYKIVEFKVNGCNAHMAVIYDASRLSVGVSKRLGISGQMVTNMAKEQEAVLAINGGGFYDENYAGNGANPIGVTISKGKIITDYNYNSSGGIIGLTNDNVLVLLKGKNASDAIKMGVRDAVTMGPFLIVNGKNSFIQGNGGWGVAARTAIGQRADGIILLLVVDSNATRTNGANMRDLAEIMEKYGAVNASNLDGGTSSVMVHHYEIINDPIDSTLAHKTRAIPTMFMLK